MNKESVLSFKAQISNSLSADLQTWSTPSYRTYTRANCSAESHFRRDPLPWSDLPPGKCLNSSAADAWGGGELGKGDEDWSCLWPEYELDVVGKKERWQRNKLIPSYCYKVELMKLEREESRSLSLSLLNGFFQSGLKPPAVIQLLKLNCCRS